MRRTTFLVAVLGLCSWGPSRADNRPKLRPKVVSLVEANQQVSTNAGKETAAAWNESAGSARGVTAVAFTNATCLQAGTCARWAATDPDDDEVWIQHSENSAADWDTSSFAFAPGDPPIQWGPDPLILGVPVSGNVKTRDRFVYIGMLSSQLTTNRDIFIAVSDDGARSFHNFTAVSQPGSRLNVDRPAATVDPVNGTVWVQWVSDDKNPPGKYWVAAITIPSAAGSAPVVGSPSPIPLPSGAPRAAHGALAVRHVDDTTTEVMFAWPDGYGSAQGCPGGNTFTDGYNQDPITWYFSSKVFKPAGTGNWKHNVITTAAAHTYLQCVDPAFIAGGAGNAAYGVGATPWLVFEPVFGKRYVVLGRTMGKGEKAHIHLYSSKDGVTWADRQLTDARNVGSHQWRPSMSLLPSRLAVGYFSTQEQTASGNMSRWAALLTLGPLTRVSHMQISRPAAGETVPWFGNGPTGDYQGMAADLLKGRFVDTWSDQRGPSPPAQPMVFATRFRPAP